MSDEQIRRIFQKQLNAYMTARNITPNQICETLGVSKGAVSQWKNGSKVPRIDKIDKLATMFGCSRSDLLQDKSAPITDALSQEEMDLIVRLRKLNQQNLNQVNTMVDFLNAQQNK